MASRIVTLFTEQKIAEASSPSMVASVAAHFLTVGVLFVLVKVAAPHVVHVPPQDFSVVRVLTFQPDRAPASAGGGSMYYEAQNVHAMKSAGGTRYPRRRILPPNPKLKTGPQTLLQAHANNVPPPQHAVIPTVLLTAAHPKITEKIFTLPPKQNPAAPTPRLLNLPNAETHVADVMLSSTAFTTPDAVLPPSTTVPYKLDHPTVDAQIVETSSPTEQTPTPTRLLAISDLRIIKGTIVIPQAENEVQKTSNKGAMVSGAEDQTPGAGSGSQKGMSLLRAALSGTGTNGVQPEGTVDPHASNDPPANSATPSTAKGIAPGMNIPATTADGPTAQEQVGAGNGNQISFTHLSKSKTGQFGAVLMGDSAQEDFPETSDLWAGRNAYTVYINVGTPTSWILQYSLPKSATPSEQQEQLNAPYPYDLLRPNFPASELNADDLLVHGFINAEGKLLNLSVAFPPGFTLAKLILKALSQWQFRPAMLNGTPTEVEVLLIIPNGQNGV